MVRLLVSRLLALSVTWKPSLCNLPDRGPRARSVFVKPRRFLPRSVAGTWRGRFGPSPSARHGATKADVRGAGIARGSAPRARAVTQAVIVRAQKRSPFGDALARVRLLRVVAGGRACRVDDELKPRRGSICCNVAPVAAPFPH